MMEPGSGIGNSGFGKAGTAVIPAQAGIQFFSMLFEEAKEQELDSRLRGNDERSNQSSSIVMLWLV
jgi:hypothetical protein